MTAEAPSAVSAGESPQSVLDSELPRRPLLPSQNGSGSFPFPPNGVRPNGVSPDGDGSPGDGAAPVEDRADTTAPAAADATEVDPAQSDTVRAEPADADLADAHLTDADLADADLTETDLTDADLTETDLTDTDLTDADLVEADFAGPESVRSESGQGDLVEADFAGPESVRSEFGRADLVEADFAGPESVRSESGLGDTAEADFAGADGVRSGFGQAETVEPAFVRAETFELGTAEPEAYPAGSDGSGSDGEPVMVETATVDAVLADPVELTDDPDLATEAVAHEVADQLGSVVGEDVEADPAEFAAAAVLDVLRAAGWADAAEAAELRAEATRTRELLSEVIRDHRAREASAAGGQNQQLYWLIPLLRAAHGVAFGSLGAKVALRTAVQEVPPDVLASAGLRIDYGVEPAYED